MFGGLAIHDLRRGSGWAGRRLASDSNRSFSPKKGEGPPAGGPSVPGAHSRRSKVMLAPLTRLSWEG